MCIKYCIVLGGLGVLPVWIVALNSIISSIRFINVSVTVGLSTTLLHTHILALMVILQAPPSLCSSSSWRQLGVLQSVITIGETTIIIIHKLCLAWTLLLLLSDGNSNPCKTSLDRSCASLRVTLRLFEPSKCESQPPLGPLMYSLGIITVLVSGCAALFIEFVCQESLDWGFLTADK